MRKTFRRILCASFILALALGLCACHGDDGKSFNSYDAANKEFKETVASLIWPDNYTVPTELDGEKKDPLKRAMVTRGRPNIGRKLGKRNGWIIIRRIKNGPIMPLKNWKRRRA